MKEAIDIEEELSQLDILELRQKAAALLANSIGEDVGAALASLETTIATAGLVIATGDVVQRSARRLR